MSLYESQRSIHPTFLAVRQYIGHGSKKVSLLLGAYLCRYGRLSLNILRKLKTVVLFMDIIS